VARALELIRSERERHFDPAVADAFLGALPEIHRIREKYAENGTGESARPPAPCRAERDAWPAMAAAL
jgi:HD-GYP domain-containing protein (c-di-GMP phosphodiesterase class II)